ncbi:MAG: YchF family ATPase [Thermoanaerobaculum sp.]|nr:YchF family ATPase [Thermoanaerobaculum sp.]
MEFGILGLSGAGKSTLFSLLTGAEVPPHTGKTVVGIAKVPDRRLEALTALFQPRKHTPATVKFVDVPPISRGGAAALNLPELRTTDALAVVLRAFADPQVPHPEGSLDPKRDLELIETELLLSDLGVVTGRLDRLRKELVKRRTPELEKEEELLGRCLAFLEQGRPLRELPLQADEQKIVKGFTFLTGKPLLVVLNADEAEASNLPQALHRWGLGGWEGKPQVACTAVSAPLEREIARLAPEEQAAFVAELGLPDRALNRLLQQAFFLLGQISFFTVGEDECRAWPIPQGSSAHKAAGVIHSDFQRGFIRAEVVRWDELVSCGSLAACRSKGLLRQEGKDYLVQDGDVITFKFHV